MYVAVYKCISTCTELRNHLQYSVVVHTCAVTMYMYMYMYEYNVLYLYKYMTRYNHVYSTCT